MPNPHKIFYDLTHCPDIVPRWQKNLGSLWFISFHNNKNILALNALNKKGLRPFSRSSVEISKGRVSDVTTSECAVTATMWVVPAALCNVSVSTRATATTVRAWCCSLYLFRCNLWTGCCSHYVCRCSHCVGYCSRHMCCCTKAQIPSLHRLSIFTRKGSDPRVYAHCQNIFWSGAWFSGQDMDFPIGDGSWVIILRPLF